MSALRVLVVDDSHDTVMTLTALLETDGYSAKGCYSAGEVMPCIRAFDPDVVLLDIALPGKSGWEVARTIRLNYPGTRPLVIGISGVYTGGADRVLAKISGFDHYLTKPADITVLKTLIDKAA